jgi:hypothetical protein
MVLLYFDSKEGKALFCTQAHMLAYIRLLLAILFMNTDRVFTQNMKNAQLNIFTQIRHITLNKTCSRTFIAFLRTNYCLNETNIKLISYISVANCIPEIYASLSSG